MRRTFATVVLASIPATILAQHTVPTAAGGPEGPFSRRTPVVVTVEKVGPAVVNIATEKIIERQMASWFFFEPQYLKALSLGSGIIVDPRGYVVTNGHVISRATTIQVHLRDGRKMPARLIAVDSAEDTALIKLEGDGPFPFLEMGRSDDLMIGETVIALGNPFGLENSVSTGVVSAKNRSIEAEGRPVFQDMIQTDASINPGNSGGALVNINGQLIGIDTAIKAGAQGIGFAIPVNKVVDTLLRITTPERSRHVSFGMRLRRPDRDDSGIAVVSDLDPHGPAVAAGLRPGDRIVGVGADSGGSDSNATSALALNLWLMERRRDEKVRFRIARRGDTAEATVKVGRSAGPPWWLLGIDFGEDADDRDAPLRIQAIERNGPAEEAGLREDDVIFNFGGVDVKSTLEFERKLIPQVESGQPVEIAIQRGRRSYRATVHVR